MKPYWQYCICKSCRQGGMSLIKCGHSKNIYCLNCTKYLKEDELEITYQ